MPTPLQALIRLLDVQAAGHDHFNGDSLDIVGPRVFGGQVLGQAVVAVGRTVEAARRLHSLHAYFMRPGDASLTIDYAVERLRDGGSFTTRRVDALQRGRPIFTMIASFHRDEPGPEHQCPYPANLAGPEELENERTILDRYLDRLPQFLREGLSRPAAIEFRPVEAFHPLEPESHEPLRHSWFRLRGPAGDDPLIHKALLAYASDCRLLGTSLLPHGRTFFQGHTQMASLDHAMWFHRTPVMDDWMLYYNDSPSASGARGLTRGSIFDRHGHLLASVAQEGLIRPLRGRADRRG